MAKKMPRASKKQQQPRLKVSDESMTGPEPDVEGELFRLLIFCKL
jgi:hypothetical protein